jgi:hypothetical protein
MTEITKYEANQIPQLMKTADVLFKSGMFPQAKNSAGIFTIVEYGREIGLPPVIALQNLSIVNGRLCMSGQSMLGIAMKHGIFFKIIEETKEKCAVEFKRDKIEYTSTFTMEDADKITINREGKKLSEKDVWKNYPQTMLKWRAVSQGLRIIASDLLSGIYLPEEISSIKEEDKAVDTPEPSDDDKGVTEQDVKDVFDEKEPPQDTNDGITVPQTKAIRAALSKKGIDAFYELFKKYLVIAKLLDDAETLKTMTKKNASGLIDKLDEHIINFFTMEEHHAEMKRLFNILAKKTQIKILMTMTYFIKDIDSVPKKITEDLTDEYSNSYFDLFLKAIVNQYESGVPVNHEDTPPSLEEPPKKEVDLSTGELEDFGV